MAEKKNDRRFPRAKETIPVKLTHDHNGAHFEATLYTRDISLTGVFFVTEFFLKAGMELELELTMPNDDRPVRVKGLIAREVRLDEVRGRNSRETVSGFAVRFVEYHADAKAVLASSFLSADLHEFVDDYLQRRTRKAKDENDQLRDVLIAWEVAKMEIVGGELDVIRDRIHIAKDGKIRRR